MSTTGKKNNKAVVAPKSPDQDEIDQIMNEIEELRNDLEETGAEPELNTASHSEKVKLSIVPEAEAMAAVEEDILAEFQQGGSPEMSMEETLGDLKEEDSGKPSLLDQAMQSNESEEIVAETAENTDEEAAAESEVEGEFMANETDRDGGESDGTLTMTLTGNMALKLKYEMDGKEVAISFTNQTLKVTLENGTEFKIPLGASPQKKNLRRAA